MIHRRQNPTEFVSNDFYLLVIALSTKITWQDDGQIDDNHNGKPKSSQKHCPGDRNPTNAKGVISNFIVLIKLPRHVSASECHPQGVTRSLYATPVLVYKTIITTNSI
jgi:hypothetical protein